MFHSSYTNDIKHWGQQQNSKIDGCKTKQDKGRDKHKGKKTKATFAELLEKYKKESEARSAYRPSIAKSSRSPPRRKSKDRDWQREKFNAAASYPPFRTPMPMSWIPSYGDCYTYPSWDHRYDPRARYPSYYRSSNPNYAAPRRSKSEQQSHVKDRFNKKKSVRSSRKKKEVVKQVYQVKKDNRKSDVSDSILSNKELVNLILATNDKEMKQVTVEARCAKSEQVKLKVPKAKEQTPPCKIKSQPGCSLGLRSWQERKLKRLSAEKLKRKNMAWVPKEEPQGKEDVQVPIARIATRMKEEKTEAGKRSSKNFLSYNKRFRSAQHTYYSAMSFMPMPCSISSGMISYPPWSYFNPWMHYNSLHHQRVLPNRYSFG